MSQGLEVTGPDLRGEVISFMAYRLFARCHTLPHRIVGPGGDISGQPQAVYRFAGQKCLRPIGWPLGDSPRICDSVVATDPSFPIIVPLRTLLECDINEMGEENEWLERLLGMPEHLFDGPALAQATVAMAMVLVARVTGDGSVLPVAERLAAASQASPSATLMWSTVAEAALGLAAVLQGGEAGFDVGVESR